MLAAYQRHLRRRPLLTTAVQAAVIYSSGDALTQVAIEKKSKFDFNRQMSMFWTGLLFAGPSMHLWYGSVLPRLVGVSHGKALTLFKSILLDQTLYSIPFNLTVITSLSL